MGILTRLVGFGIVILWFFMYLNQRSLRDWSVKIMYAR